MSSLEEERIGKLKFRESLKKDIADLLEVIDGNSDCILGLYSILMKLIKDSDESFKIKRVLIILLNAGFEKIGTEFDKKYRPNLNIDDPVKQTVSSN